MTRVKVEHVTAYRGGELVLRDLDVEVKGQVVGFLGPSGVGKTTLLRILAGLERPDRGRVLVDGTPVRAGTVGVVHQCYPLFDHRTVLDNLVVAARAAGASRDAARTRALAMLERFELADRAGAWPRELSGGQRQRVAILQQLVRGHTFLLMDEPFSGLDPINKAKTCALITEVARLDARTTIIVVTHDIREAVGIADTLWLMGREPGSAGARIVETYERATACASQIEARFATL
ncbi:MAG: ABC transporter ATP-binding protein [Kofleriaceae bacterium]